MEMGGGGARLALKDGSSPRHGVPIHVLDDR